MHIAHGIGSRGHQTGPVHPNLNGLIGAIAIEPVFNLHIVQAQWPITRVHHLDLWVRAVGGSAGHTTQQLNLEARAGNNRRGGSGRRNRGMGERGRWRHRSIRGRGRNGSARSST